MSIAARLWLCGFFCPFLKVMGNLLLSTLELQADGRLRYEIISGSLEALSTSGGERIEGEDIPEVKAFPVSVQQLAFLRKKE